MSAAKKRKVTSLSVRCLRCGAVVQVTESIKEATCSCKNHLTLKANDERFSYAACDMLEVERVYE